jgi:hypothetical protein
MARSRIPPTLIVSGALLFVLYALGWGGLLWMGRTAERDVPPAAEAPADTPQLDYRVTDAEGQEHLLRVSSSDPSQLLMEVSRRFGDGASVQRLEPREAAQARQEASGVSHLWVGLLLVLPLSLILAGVRMRRREHELFEVWKALKPTLSLPLRQLLQRTGQSEGVLKENLVRLSQRGWADLQYHPETGRVFDARLSAYSLSLSYCPQCNEPANARMLADLNNIPICPGCMNAYDASFLEAQKKDLVERLVAESSRRMQGHPMDGDFSLGRYALLVLLFPPFALSYALTRAG